MQGLSCGDFDEENLLFVHDLADPADSLCPEDFPSEAAALPAPPDSDYTVPACQDAVRRTRAALTFAAGNLFKRTIMPVPSLVANELHSLDSMNITIGRQDGDLDLRSEALPAPAALDALPSDAAALPSDEARWTYSDCAANTIKRLLATAMCSASHI